jgi:hypothetical protein
MFINDMKEYNEYPTGGASTGPGMGQYVPVADLNASKKVKLKKKKKKEEKEEDWSELFDGIKSNYFYKSNGN